MRVLCSRAWRRTNTDPYQCDCDRTSLEERRLLQFMSIELCHFELQDSFHHHRVLVACQWQTKLGVIFFFFEGLYFQENFIWKTSILKTRVWIHSQGGHRLCQHKARSLTRKGGGGLPLVPWSIHSTLGLDHLLVTIDHPAISNPHYRELACTRTTTRQTWRNSSQRRRGNSLLLRGEQDLMADCRWRWKTPHPRQPGLLRPPPNTVRPLIGLLPTQFNHSNCVGRRPMTTHRPPPNTVRPLFGLLPTQLDHSSASSQHS